MEKFKKFKQEYKKDFVIPFISAKRKRYFHVYFSASARKNK